MITVSKSSVKEDSWTISFLVKDQQMQVGGNARPGAQYHSLENHHKGHLLKGGVPNGQSGHESGGYAQYAN